jgi:hypothetical protein
MKTLAKLLPASVFVLLMGTAGSALAGNELVTVLNVGCQENGECFIIVSPSLASPSSCVTNRSQVRFMSTQPGAESMYKAALGSFFAGKRLVVNPSASLCLSGFMRPVYVHTTDQ